MDDTWRAILWRQYGAAIDMLDEALRACPDDLWRAPLWNARVDESAGSTQFWYLGYHTLFWLDYYLSVSEEGFMPPTPFTLDEFDPAGVIPERPYTKAELSTYLDHGRHKCQATIGGLTDEQANGRRQLSKVELSFAELQLYTMRHVQEHAAQLNMFLGQRAGSSVSWVAEAKSQPSGE